MAIKTVTTLLLLCTIITSCRNSSTGAQADVIAAIAPVSFIVDRIMGRKGSCRTLLPLEASPHSWYPAPGQLKPLAEAKVYFSAGLALENRLKAKIKELNPDIIWVDLSLIVHHIKSHEEGQEEEHHHIHEHDPADHDPHIWLSLKNQDNIAAAVLNTLKTAGLVSNTEADQGLRDFRTSSRYTELRILEKIKKSGNKHFMTFHPSWAYFAEEFGLEQMAIEVDGKTPTARQLEHILAEAKRLKPPFILVEPRHSTRSAELISQKLNIPLVELDPLSYDVHALLLDLADRL